MAAPGSREKPIPRVNPAKANIIAVTIVAASEVLEERGSVACKNLLENILKI